MDAKWTAQLVVGLQNIHKRTSYSIISSSTHLLNDCKELMDVSTGPSPLAIETQGTQDRKYRLQCEICSGYNVTSCEEPLTCPKCGGDMDKGDMTTLWD